MSDLKNKLLNSPYAFSVVLFLFLMSGLTFIFVIGSIPPKNFPINKIVEIKKGATLFQISKYLENDNVVRSAFLYRIYARMFGGQIRSGAYMMKTLQSSLNIAIRTTKGEQGLPKVKITIPEGSTSYDIAWILLKNIPGFNTTEFLSLAKPKEGYLFPETYFFDIVVKPDEIVGKMLETFEKNISKLENKILDSGRKLEDIVIMASIVEEEARFDDDKVTVSSILWKRIDAGMPLQVDAPFYYIFGKTSAMLSNNDLVLDNLFNTYKHKGLPPAPISNPGIVSLEATLNATSTKYWFFLSDKEGNMHFAVTHAGHIANRNKYIK